MKYASGLVTPQGVPVESLPDRNVEDEVDGFGTPVLYLDLDGTVRLGADELNGRFVNKPEDVRVFPGVPRLLEKYKKDGWRIVGVTNQGGVAMGHMTEKVALACGVETDRQCDGLFDTIFTCFHHPSSKDPKYRSCLCRKPRYGMIVWAEAFLTQKFGGHYPFDRALVVGDRPEDREMAKAAGIKFKHASDWRNELHGK